jgi:hypothetical protein
VLNEVLADAQPLLELWLATRSGRAEQWLRNTAMLAIRREIPTHDGTAIYAAYQFVRLLPEDNRPAEVLPAVRRFRGEAEERKHKLELAEAEHARWVRVLLGMDVMAEEGKP